MEVLDLSVCLVVVGVVQCVTQGGQTASWGLICSLQTFPRLRSSSGGREAGFAFHWPNLI